MFIKTCKNMIFLLFILAAGIAAQDKQPDKEQDKQKAAEVTGKPVMWEAVSVKDMNLLAGPGGEVMKPDLSSITFIKQETGGYSTKYKIKDAAGKIWVAKVGAEAQSETASVRLLFALGYKTEINYLIPHLTIPEKGDFTNVRLEARPADVKRLETWSWRDNPFKGTREFQGLKIMMSFLNNWDMKQANNVIMERGDRLEYVISDLGVSFGKTGSNGLPIFWRVGRSRNDPKQYAESEFIKQLKSGKIQFAFNGKNDGSLGDVTKADGRWIADLLLQLTDKQIEDAFRAANYTDAEVASLTQSVKNRIKALDMVTSGQTTAN